MCWYELLYILVFYEVLRYNVPRDVPRLIGGGFHFRLKAERANRPPLGVAPFGKMVLCEQNHFSSSLNNYSVRFAKNRRRL
jgi:hypothetical protein